jgi:hypothetical protein
MPPATTAAVPAFSMALAKPALPAPPASPAAPRNAGSPSGRAAASQVVTGVGVRAVAAARKVQRAA